MPSEFLIAAYVIIGLLVFSLKEEDDPGTPDGIRIVAGLIATFLWPFWLLAIIIERRRRNG